MPSGPWTEPISAVSQMHACIGDITCQTGKGVKTAQLQCIGPDIAAYHYAHASSLLITAGTAMLDSCQYVWAFRKHPSRGKFASLQSVQCPLCYLSH